MTLHTMLVWLWSSLQYFWPFIVEAVLGAIVVYYLVPHSLAASAQCEVGKTRFRFLLQNNEDVPFLGPFGIRIRLVDRNARFVDQPQVFAGCKRLPAAM